MNITPEEYKEILRRRKMTTALIAEHGPYKAMTFWDYLPASFSDEMAVRRIRGDANILQKVGIKPGEIP